MVSINDDWELYIPLNRLLTTHYCPLTTHKYIYMNLQGIVAISGKPGLWRALAQNKTGYILESLDAHKTKLIANLSTTKMAALNEITIFGLEDDIKLRDIFERMKNASNIPDPKADGKKLREFFREVSPDHDEEKVYTSDIKKVLNWYLLLKELPLFSENDPEAAVTEEAPKTVIEEKPLKRVNTKEKKEPTNSKANPKKAGPKKV